MTEPKLAWQPDFSCNSHRQEQLAIQFCLEIAGPRGQKGLPPDPVRLLEMAQALYLAELEDVWRTDFLPPIDGYELAVEVLHHIDRMYPDMWKPVAKQARLSIRNVIVSEVVRRQTPKGAA